MGGAVDVFEWFVVAAACVFVADDEGNGAAESKSFKNAREDFDAVGFGAGGGDFGLAGAAAVEFVLNFLDGKRHARRASVDHNADGSAVAFAEGADAK